MKFKAEDEREVFEVGTTRESVSYDVGLALDVLNICDVIISQEFKPAGKASSEVGLALDETKGIVISLDFNGNTTTYIVSPCAQAFFEVRLRRFPT